MTDENEQQPWQTEAPRRTRVRAPTRKERPSETKRRLDREQKRAEREAAAAAGVKKPRRKYTRRVKRKQRDEVEATIVGLLKLYRTLKHS